MLVEMTPGVVSHGGVLEEQRLERQIGCMAGFLHLFDRGHIIVGRRGISARRLTAASIAGSSSTSTRSDSTSPSLSKESQPPPPSSPEVCPSFPESGAGTPAARRLLPLPLQVFETGEGGRASRRIRDVPRLSLDSRAVLDAKGKLHPRQIRTAARVKTGAQSDASEAEEEQRRSPSVVARLMGLEGFPSHSREGGAEPDGIKLQRSASESRVRKDLSCYGFVDGSSIHNAHPGPAGSEPISAEEFFKSVSLAKFKLNNTTKAMPPSKNGQPLPLQRKIFFDADDIFPEPKRPGTLYGEIEKRLRMRGIDEPAKDMETVKQILEALQLKGLLHSNPSHLVGGRRNPYSDQCVIHEGAPIVIMKSTTKTLPGRTGELLLLPPRMGAAPQRPSLVNRERSPVDRLFRGNERRNRAPKSPEIPSSPVNRRPQNAVAHRSSQPQRRTSPVVSPKSSPKRLGPDFLAARSPRSRQPTDPSSEDRVYSPAEDDPSTTFSENSAIVSSQYDFVRSKAEEYLPGRNLLERCDKLLHNIAAFTGAEQSTASDLQPSPVSVLDSLAFLGEEGSPSPSPLSKRSIDFKDLLTDDREESQWSSTESTIEGDANVGLGGEDPDYRYVCEVVRACDRYGDACAAVYAVLEKRRAAVDSCKADRLHRRLLFDTVSEILDRTRRVSPWDAFSRAISSPPTPGWEEVPPRQVWTDIRRLRELATAGEECGMDDAAVGGAVRKDIDGRLNDGWSRPGPELSDTVLHIERLVFKDLIADAIRDLAAANATGRRLVPRRKLEF